MTVKGILATISDIIKRQAEDQAEDQAFKLYVAECLRVLTENTAKMGGGSYISASFADILNPKPVDDRTGEEIVAEIIQKAGLEVV